MQHNLTSLDEKKRKAICSVCGPTEIVHPSQWRCLQARNKSNEVRKRGRQMASREPVNHKLSKVDVVKKTAICVKCGKVKIYPAGSKAWRCQEVYRLATARRYKERYGVDEATYFQLVAEAKGRCMICRKKTPLHLDHNHGTGKARGLLCGNCNRGIGVFQEDIHKLIMACKYLRERNEWEASG